MSVKCIDVRFLAASLLKPPFGGFRIETVIWIQKWFKKSVGTSRKFYLPGIIVFQGGDDGRGYRNMCEIAGGLKPDLGHLYIWHITHATQITAVMINL